MFRERAKYHACRPGQRRWSGRPPLLCALVAWVAAGSAGCIDLGLGGTAAAPGARGPLLSSTTERQTEQAELCRDPDNQGARFDVMTIKSGMLDGATLHASVLSLGATLFEQVGVPLEGKCPDPVSGCSFSCRYRGVEFYGWGAPSESPETEPSEGEQNCARLGIRVEQGSLPERDKLAETIVQGLRRELPEGALGTHRSLACDEYEPDVIGPRERVAEFPVGQVVQVCGLPVQAANETYQQPLQAQDPCSEEGPSRYLALTSHPDLCIQASLLQGAVKGDKGEVYFSQGPVGMYQEVHPEVVSAAQVLATNVAEITEEHSRKWLITSALDRNNADRKDPSLHKVGWALDLQATDGATQRLFENHYCEIGDAVQESLHQLVPGASYQLILEKEKGYLIHLSVIPPERVKRGGCGHRPGPWKLFHRDWKPERKCFVDPSDALGS